MANTASGVGLIPEQAWENADLAPSAYGTQARVRVDRLHRRQGGRQRIAAHLVRGPVRPAVRRTSGPGSVTERPVDTTFRYIQHTQRVDPPHPDRAGEQQLGQRLDDGHRDHGAATPRSTSTSSTSTWTAPRSRPPRPPQRTARSASPSPHLPGTDVITVAATASERRHRLRAGHRHLRLRAGDADLRRPRPDRRRQRPGDVRLPDGSATSSPGAYDLQQFQVYDSGTDSVTFRVQTADLTPTFGSPAGRPAGRRLPEQPGRRRDVDGGVVHRAQLRDRLGIGVEPTDRGPRLRSALRRRGGATVGSVQIRANALSRYITFTVSKTDLGGTPDQRVDVRGRAHRPGRVQLRPGTRLPVDRAGRSSSASARLRPSQRATRSARSTLARCPRRWTSSHRSGTDQADELDPTLHSPVTIKAVTIP